MPLPQREGLGYHFYDMDGERCWILVPIGSGASPGDRLILEEFGTSVEVVRCEESTYKSNIDERFGVPLCRDCFYAAAEHWRQLNVEAGLCACGVDCMPGIQQCRECNARRKRNNARRANRERAERRKAEAEAEKKRAQDEETRKRKARLDALTHEQVHAALAEADGNRPNAGRALGLQPGELANWMSRAANRNVAWKYTPRTKQQAAMESARHRWPS